MNQAVDLDELTLFRDMARRAFEKEISPYYEEWEHNHMVPASLEYARTSWPIVPRR